MKRAAVTCCLPFARPAPPCPPTTRGLDWVEARPIGQGPLQGLAYALADPAGRTASRRQRAHGPGLPYLLSGNLAALMADLADWPRRAMAAAARRRANGR